MSKKKKSFPTAFTVLFIVLILASILTYVVPSGLFSKLQYDGEKKVFVVTKPDGTTNEMPGTQETLNKLGVKIGIEKFEDGSIYKPIAIPGTYERVESNPQGLIDLLQAPIKGIQESIDIIVFVLIMGGLIGVLNSTGAFEAGIASLSRATKGKEFLLIVIITTLIAIGGTTFGMAEETIALYPILIPVFIAAGYDALVCIAAIYMGSSIGTMFSTVNPFASVIASNAAGITFTEGLTIRFIGLLIAVIITIVYIVKYANKVKKDATMSLIYSQKQEIEEKFLKDYYNKDVPEFTLRRKLMLVIFGLAFVVMIWGVSSQDWWFTEMTTLFLAVSLIIALISGMQEKEFVNKFISGASELVGVALIIGVARGINLILDKGLISDTILYAASKLVEGMNPVVFVIVILIIFIVLGFFIPSSSGLAVLSMPIIAPLADSVGLSRDIIVSAYQYGQGLIAFITPTGLILATLGLVDVTYDKWLKFVIRLMGYIGGFAIIMLLIQAFVR